MKLARKFTLFFVATLFTVDLVGLTAETADARKGVQGKARSSVSRPSRSASSRARAPKSRPTHKPRPTASQPKSRPKTSTAQTRPTKQGARPAPFSRVPRPVRHRASPTAWPTATPTRTSTAIGT